MEGGFGPDLLPTPANADDDEFNGLTLSSAWQLLGATVQAGDPQRGVTIVGPNVVRQSLNCAQRLVHVPAGCWRLLQQAACDFADDRNGLC